MIKNQHTSSEASRAKHKYAVKRNSWPKTRGVAMNPVDHVRPTFHPTSSFLYLQIIPNAYQPHSLTVVEIINISAKPPPSLAWPRQVKKPVSLQRGERVYFAGHKKRRTRWVCSGRGFLFSIFTNGWMELGLCIGNAGILDKGTNHSHIKQTFPHSRSTLSYTTTLRQSPRQSKIIPSAV